MEITYVCVLNYILLITGASTILEKIWKLNYKHRVKKYWDGSVAVRFIVERTAGLMDLPVIMDFKIIHFFK